MSLPTEAQPLQAYEPLTFHAHASDDGAPIFPQLSIGRENSLLRTILPPQNQDWYHTLSIKDLQNIVPSQINNQQARIAQPNSYNVNDPKLVEQLSQLHAQASGQHVDLVQAMHAGIPTSQPSASLGNVAPQTEMSLRAENVFKQVLEQQPEQQRRGAPASTPQLSQPNLQAITNLVAQNPRIAETMSFVDLVRLASQIEDQETKARLVNTPSQVFQAFQNQQAKSAAPLPAQYSAAPAVSETVAAQHVQLPDPNLYPSAQASKSTAAVSAAIRRQRRANMIKANAEDGQNSSQLLSSGPGKTGSAHTESEVIVTCKQGQGSRKSPRGKSQEDIDLSAEKKRLRAIRNRDSAKRHRERKQAYQTALEDEVNSLIQENEALKKLLQISTEGNKNADRLQELERLKKSIENPNHPAMKDEGKDLTKSKIKGDQNKQDFVFFDDDKDKDIEAELQMEP